ncbi:hypothetical protein ACFST9_04285 [Hymenobacter monticola]|uniref:Uncharacterized protein n=1 Tax=Hymenobacter monticola TaxID=1705399 RepID=A0ABY4B0Y3_9BACT|nr:hypothetical protein [Hymenobacter monticola]UOE32827.1 hypothetical protein MTP16_17035 [Hymenobacter monticola]
MYRIKSGSHYSRLFPSFTFKHTIRYRCRFENSCLYQLEGEDAFDINKLVGFSTSWNHHQQSARIGWRCMDGQTIELLTYTYADGKRDVVDTILAVVKPEEEFDISITDFESCYEYTVRVGELESTARKWKVPDRWLFQWILHPFFGGQTAAPHEMKIHLTKI